MQAYLHRKVFTKWFILNKVCISKTMLENEFQNVIFIKYFLWFQRIIFQTIFLFCIMQIKPFCQILQSLLKSCFIRKTCLFELMIWILENSMFWFEEFWRYFEKFERNKRRKQKRKKNLNKKKVKGRRATVQPGQRNGPRPSYPAQRGTPFSFSPSLTCGIRMSGPSSSPGQSPFPIR
jgi:hypothetical protein